MYSFTYCVRTPSLTAQVRTKTGDTLLGLSLNKEMDILIHGSPVNLSW